MPNPLVIEAHRPDAGAVWYSPAVPSLTTVERAALDSFCDGARAALGPNLLELRLFGSKARGDASADADLDVLVVVAENRVAAEDRVLDLDSIKALAALPSREALLSQLLSAMIGVPTGLVRVLNGIPQKLMYALLAIKDQKEAA